MRGPTRASRSCLWLSRTLESELLENQLASVTFLHDARLADSSLSTRLVSSSAKAAGAPAGGQPVDRCGRLVRMVGEATEISCASAPQVATRRRVTELASAGATIETGSGDGQ
jgi:hypothetical protein